MRYTAALNILLMTAIPFTLGRLVQVLGDFGSVGLLAQMGTSMLAATGLIIACQTLIMVPLSSILNATVILINPNEPASAGRVLRSTWLLSILLSIPTITFFLFSNYILHFFNQPTQLIKTVVDYLRVYSFSIPFYYALFANQQFAIAIKKPMIAFTSTLINVSLTLFLGYGFIFGNFGLPILHEKGLGLATSLSTAFTFLVITASFARTPFKKFGIFKNEWSILALLSLFKKGIPIGIFVATEIVAMSIATFFVGLLGQDALAAQQAASAYLYMLTSLLIAGSQAATANVRAFVWQQQFDNARIIGNTAIQFWTVFSLITGCILFAFPDKLLLLFLDNKTLPNVSTLASALLQIHGIGLIFDAIRNAATGGLRAIGDVKTPMIVSFITTCFVALSLGYILGIEYGWGAVGIYIARNIGLALGAAILSYSWFRAWKTRTTLMPSYH